MGEQKKILVIDPDPFERIRCRVMLRGVEFIVSFCEDGKSAVERVSRETFDLIITNILLPNKYSGLTLVQELHFLQPQTDIIVMADRPSIWDARESLKLGASGYIERPFVPECLMNMVRKMFDHKGWIVRKACIDQFRDYAVTAQGDHNPLIYYKNGSWARHLNGCMWEIGYDMKYWSVPDDHRNGSSAHLAGDLRRIHDHRESPSPYAHALSVRVSGLSSLVTGEPYAEISGSSGTYALPSPMSGIVKDVNEEANDIMTSYASGHRGTDWMLWLARILAREWEYGTARDIDEGRVVGRYEHVECPDHNVTEHPSRRSASYAGP